MRQRTTWTMCVLVLGISFGVAPWSAAQEAPQPLTWLMNVTVKPGQMMALQTSAETYDKPVLDQLVADGAITSWGLGCQMVGPMGEGCMYWVTAADWSAMGKVEKAFEDSRKAMKEEELRDMMETFIGATEPDQERSSVVRHVVFNGNPGAAPAYLMRHVYAVKPGHGRKAVQMFKAYNAPTFEKLLSEGVITGYGLAVPEMHTGGGWTHTGWVTFTDMAQLDAIDAAFEAADSAREESVNDMLQAAWTEMHDMSAHWDSLMRISLYGGR